MAMPDKLSRDFIKRRLVSGTGERASRESHNALVKLSPHEITKRWGKTYRGLSGRSPMTAKESHRIYSSLGREARAERTYQRHEYRAKTEGMAYGAPEGLAPVNYQRMSDDGVMFRATNDPRYAESWEEEYSSNADAE